MNKNRTWRFTVRAERLAIGLFLILALIVGYFDPFVWIHG